MFTLNTEAAINLINDVFKLKTKKNLNALQKNICEGILLGKKYEEIALESFCSIEHIKKTSAYLLKVLSEQLKEKVTKTSLRSAIERLIREKQQEKIEFGDEENKISNQIPFFLCQETISMESSLYIERPPIENNCIQEIQKKGSLLRIKSPQKMGKTSLIAKIISLTKKDYHIVYLNLNLADKEFFSDLDLFLKWFCLSIVDQLNIADNLEEYWKSIYGVKRRCNKYFEKYLFEHIKQPLLIIIDEVDKIFLHSIADDFYGLLRAWHEQAKAGQNSEKWQKLRLLLSYSTEEYLIKDINQSPFNVGVEINLPEFTVQQMVDLAHKHSLNLSEIEIEQLMLLIGGHPYLAQIAFHYLITTKISVNDFFNLALTEAGPYSNYLRRNLRNIQQDSNLIEALKILLRSNESVELISLLKFKLYSLGIVNFEGNKVKIKHQLYRHYLQNNLM